MRKISYLFIHMSIHEYLWVDTWMSIPLVEWKSLTGSAFVFFHYCIPSVWNSTWCIKKCSNICCWSNYVKAMCSNKHIRIQGYCHLAPADLYGNGYARGMWRDDLINKPDSTKCKPLYLWVVFHRQRAFPWSTCPDALHSRSMSIASVSFCLCVTQVMSLFTSETIQFIVSHPPFYLFTYFFPLVVPSSLISWFPPVHKHFEILPI